MKIDKNTTLAEISLYGNIVKSEHIDTLFERLKNKNKPVTIGGVTVPDNLFLLTWEQFSNLQVSGTNEKDFFKPFEIILGLEEKQLLNCKLFDIIGFIIFVRNELERIAKLFEKIKHNPTSEEIQAGINNLDFGTFGTLDWFARRMGFSDHSVAEKMPLIRIYRCMEIDNATAKYEKRLRTIIDNKNKPKNRK